MTSPFRFVHYLDLPNVGLVAHITFYGLGDRTNTLCGAECARDSLGDAPFATCFPCIAHQLALLGAVEVAKRAGYVQALQGRRRLF